jgi:signal transduction histidine kinase
MRFPLRWKILSFTVLPLVTLAVATLWIVDRTITRQVYASIQDDLRRSSAVFENMLASRGRALSIESQVIAQDPKFFSVLSIPGGSRDVQVRETVAGVARDFASLTGAQVFEVLDPEGRPFASVGSTQLGEEERRRLSPPALAGRPYADVVVRGDAHYQVSVTPVYAGGRVAGALVLGMRIGREMAEQLRDFTHSEVTFLAGRTATVSTLERPSDLDALTLALSQPHLSRPQLNGSLLEVHSPEDDYVTLWRAIPQTPRESAQSYVMQRSLRAETAFLRAIRWHLLQLGIAAVLVAILAGALIARQILAPVSRLVHGAAEMERGNYDFALDVHGRDEIGYLAQRFDEMRQQQRAYVQKLQDVARLKSEFISVASHELRTPISIIKGFQELMSHGSLGPVSPQQLEALNAIRRGTGTLQRIAEDATRVAQIEGANLSVEREEVGLDPVARRAITSAEEMATQRNVQLSLDVAPDARFWRADGPRLEIAVMHLVANGIRFTPDGGRVSVSVRREGSELVIAVSDTGIGLSPERRVQIMQSAPDMRDSLHHHSSSTLEFNSRGLGLGLSIARGVVEAHGGTLTVESVEGAGSTFTLRVPDGVVSEARAA